MTLQPQEQPIEHWVDHIPQDSFLPLDPRTAAALREEQKAIIAARKLAEGLYGLTLEDSRVLEDLGIIEAGVLKRMRTASGIKLQELNNELRDIQVMQTGLDVMNRQEYQCHF